jgi:Ran GTPase-activating protein (RanGAP) involved in mRNA processing and transport
MLVDKTVPLAEDELDESVDEESVEVESVESVDEESVEVESAESVDEEEDDESETPVTLIVNVPATPVMYKPSG